MKSGLYVNSTKKLTNKIINIFRVGQCVDYDHRYSNHKSSDPNLNGTYKFLVMESENERIRLEKKLFNELKQFHIHDSFYQDTIQSRKIIDKFIEKEKLLVEQKKNKSQDNMISTLDGLVPWKDNIPNCAFLPRYKAAPILNTNTQKGKTRYRTYKGKPISDTAYKLILSIKKDTQKENNCTKLNV